MADRPRILDDLAGMAGGALSVVAGLRQEAEALVRTAVDDALRRLDLVRREELDALSDQLAKARTSQEDSAGAASDVMARLAVLEARVASLEARENDPGN